MPFVPAEAGSELMGSAIGLWQFIFVDAQFFMDAVHRLRLRAMAAGRSAGAECRMRLSTAVSNVLVARYARP
jgi:hypothetical protein